MKKFLIFALFVAFATPLVTFASDEVKPIGNGDPMLVTQVWGLNGHNTPLLKAGEKDCPTWYVRGCFDVTSTSYYINSMRNTAIQLVNKGMIDNFPSFKIWLSM